MLRIPSRNADPSITAELNSLQAFVGSGVGYSTQVELAKKLWKEKLQTNARKAIFIKIRETLAEMCSGCVRCAYCEDSLADEIEHVLPKSFFPNLAFEWENYLFACGSCNGPKSNRYGIIDRGVLREVIRTKNGPVVPPPIGVHALINPRCENPLDFMELDLGGVTQSGVVLTPTFQFVVRDDICSEDQVRAEFTISVLGMNREVIRSARENAFGGFRSRLREYASEVMVQANSDRLDLLRKDILKAPHLTVFSEMIRQNRFIPEINHLFSEAPHVLYWSLTA